MSCGFQVCIHERGVGNGLSYRSSVRDLDLHSQLLDLDALEYHISCFLTYDRDDWQDFRTENSNLGELLRLLQHVKP